MIDGVLVALALLVGAAIALAVVITAATSFARPPQGPHGGTRRDPPRQPQPQPDSDYARVPVLH
jgi:Spy/CpxP family protein refolding chaperone